MTAPSPSERASGQQATGHTGPTSWVLDPSSSSVTFTHKHTFGLLSMNGTFGQVTGSGEVLPDGTGRGRLEIAASTLDTKNPKRDEHLRSPDFFHAKEHPQIIVDIAKAVPQGADTVLADGTLTAAGQSRPLSVTAEIADASDQAITLKTTIDIDRGDFGMTWNRLGIIKGLAHVSVVARFVRSPE